MGYMEPTFSNRVSGGRERKMCPQPWVLGLCFVNFSFKLNCSQQSRKTVVNQHITSGGCIQTFLKGYPLPGQNIQFAVHYIFANWCPTSTWNWNFWQKFACGNWRIVIICSNAVDIILKIFNHVVVTLMKGFASSLHEHFATPLQRLFIWIINWQRT